jgi:hypothetical protein
MINQKNIAVLFDEKSETALSEIIKKYDLEEHGEEIFKKIKEHRMFNDSVIVHVVMDFMMGKISTRQFLEGLHKGLSISKEETKALSVDIMDNLIPLLEKIPEDELEEYNRKKTLEERGENPEDAVDKENFQKELLEKIRKTVPEPEPESEKTDIPEVNLKEIETEDVDKNAEKLKTGREPIVTAEPQGPAPKSGWQPNKEEAPPAPKADDRYREEI